MIFSFRSYVSRHLSISTLFSLYIHESVHNNALWFLCFYGTNGNVYPSISHFKLLFSCLFTFLNLNSFWENLIQEDYIYIISTAVLSPIQLLPCLPFPLRLMNSSIIIIVLHTPAPTPTHGITPYWVYSVLLVCICIYGSILGIE